MTAQSITAPSMPSASAPVSALDTGIKKSSGSRFAFYGRKVGKAAAKTLWAGAKLPFQMVGYTFKGVGAAIGAGCAGLGWAAYKTIKVIKHEEAVPFMAAVKKGAEKGMEAAAYAPAFIVYGGLAFMDIQSDHGFVCSFTCDLIRIDTNLRLAGVLAP